MTKVQEQRLTLLEDAGWRALLTIFSGDLLRDRGEVWNYIDLERRTIHIEKLLHATGVLSGGEKRLVELALSLFNHDQQVNLYKVLGGLDEQNAQLALDAIGTFLFPNVSRFRGHETQIRNVLLQRAGETLMTKDRAGTVQQTL
jgi:hypothetical protein